MTTTDGAVEPASAQLLAETAYLRLRAEILDGQLTSGTALSVPALATRLGMSRSPVREAVQRLVHDGLATCAPHRGGVVSRVDARELDEIYLVKEPLEGLATRLATVRLTVEGERALAAMLADHERLLAGGAAESTHVQCDLDLHRYIRAVAGNAVLCETLDRFEGRTNLAFPTLWRDPEAARLAVAEHRAIVEAMVAGDPDAAERAARAHVARVRVRWARRTDLEQARPALAARARA
jgi:DNA-binding GntR family transcriptional regulator